MLNQYLIVAGKHAGSLPSQLMTGHLCSVSLANSIAQWAL